MGKLLPKFRRKIVQQAAETASNFVYKYYIANQPLVLQQRLPEKWIESYEINFALYLYLYDYAPRALQYENMEVYMEWIAYFWVIMEFYSIQFEKRFQINTDSTNPFSALFEANQSQRPLVYVHRLIECISYDESPVIINFIF